MPAPRVIGLLTPGQSNFQGATLNENGSGNASGPINFISEYMGFTDPYAMNVNGAGSCWPLLQDLGLRRGVRYRILNAAIGGAKIVHFTGMVGATVTNPQLPRQTYNASATGFSGGTGAIPRYGDPDFDPCQLLARFPPAMAKTPQIIDWVMLWANGESEGLTPAAQYTDAIESLGYYALDTLGCKAFLPGFSAQGMLSKAKLEELSTAVDLVVSRMQLAGKNAVAGPNLYQYFSGKVPLYPEGNPSVRVHLTPPAQAKQAYLLDARLETAGF